MIKLFRNIRKNLISQGKTTNYLKYAIGEIVLVVIGILLALAINSWNNERQLLNNNKVFLKKILIDLNANKKRLNKIIAVPSNKQFYGFTSLEEAVKASDSLLKLTYIGLNESNLNYLLTAHFDQGKSSLNINDITYKELSNTGKLYSLGTDKLIQAITTYYKFCERETEYNTFNSNEVSRAENKFEDSFGKMMLDYEMDSIHFNIDDYPFYSNKNSKEYKDFQLGLDVARTNQNLNMIKMKEIIVKTDSLINIIKTELQND